MYHRMVMTGCYFIEWRAFIFQTAFYLTIEIHSCAGQNKNQFAYGKNINPKSSALLVIYSYAVQ